MKLSQKLATIGSAALAAVLLGGGSARADGESLLSLLGNPSVVLACFPVGQAGSGNTLTGTQNVNCGQSASTSTSGSGIAGYEVVHAGSDAGTLWFSKRVIDCPAGKRVLGGGATVTSGDALDLDVHESGPSADGTSWHVTVENSTGRLVGADYYAICADVSP
ncbi:MULTISPECIES: hypothetical protein [Streptomyces]|uniref:Secreted protein n=1 Tax=Streptomyces katrae TaxID=68223 RepID=A0ABT7GTI6_9ACTN|nr:MULTISPECIES: hypothetical protein [Streptomyces]MDK9496574.1 hypothetical protein [Streptomyces katrae]GLX18745.1 hypothetical protein Slala01_23890 [Streptomyces lavendulae subsp. lavendulae]GLX29332.1 hypothetical protein Slala02_51520 [Streptomyces lavendulae subsp. lavendulae]